MKRTMKYRAAPWLFVIFGLGAAVNWSAGSLAGFVLSAIGSIGWAAIWLFAPVDSHRGGHR